MSEEPEYVFKILTIGESGVGKTCILKRFTDNTFSKNHLATIGIDFKVKVVEVDGILIKLKMWDTAGQERFRNLTTQYYKGADGIILVYDVTEAGTFKQVDYWLNQIKSNNKGISLVLIGNKCDEPIKNRQVSKEEGEEYSKSANLPFFETSALSGEGINEAFICLSREIIKKKILDGSEGGLELKKVVSKNKRNGCC